MRLETRQKMVGYNVYIAKDGKEFDNEDACRHHEMILDGTRKVCTRCDGKGYINSHYEEYLDSVVNWGDGQYHTRWVSDTCPECGGKGYLEKKVTWE